jgi:hypothetical protein
MDRANCRSQRLESSINATIDNNVKKLTWRPYQSLCTRVVAKLPKELRFRIYGYVYQGTYIKVDWPDPWNVVGLPLLHDWVRKTPSTALLTTMKHWLGDVITYELIEHWYGKIIFRFGTDLSKI